MLLLWIKGFVDDKNRFVEKYDEKDHNSCNIVASTPTLLWVTLNYPMHLKKQLDSLMYRLFYAISVHVLKCL